MAARKSILIRFAAIYFMLVIAFGFVLYKIIVIQYVEKDNWLQLSEKLERKGRPILPNRGNIFSCDGQLMASTVPYYHLYMDTRVEYLHINHGANYKKEIDSLGYYLSKKFGDKSPKEYVRYINAGYNRGDGKLKISPKAVTYGEWKEIKNYPIFNKGKYRGGLIEHKYVTRVHPFGSLATRTIGKIYGESDKGGAFGLELKYDSLLKGKQGYENCQLVGDRWIYIPVKEPEDGLDITSTIDVRIQDIAEKALADKLTEIDALRGCAIVMEVQSGAVKACVNLSRTSTGHYEEKYNMAVADMSEPGSTFKTISLTVALEDGVVKPTDIIDTKDGLCMMYGRKMIDHNYHHDGSGGYHKISVAEGLAYSSNIAVSHVIDEHYGNNPSAFVDGIYRTKINEPMDLEVPGTGKPWIRHPKAKNANWYNTALPWMSIGYEVQMPPIYTLAFYNAIANDSKLIQPFFVKKISKDGQTLEDFSAKTINRSICSQQTLNEIREMLNLVIEKGTGKVVKSSLVKIAGKTGTAQLQYGKGKKVTHQVSFCGYFPADKPQYSCIVVIREPNIGYPSGGTMSGKVFKNIAERIYAGNVHIRPMDMPKDSIFLPYVKSGNMQAAKTVLSELDINYTATDSEWAKFTDNGNEIEASSLTIGTKTIPNVVGMGAKDAVYLMERAGLHVQLYGCGKVQSQSVPAGGVATRGQTVTLMLN
ncbi:MAG: PASTA domain-containing protein [Sphingobacteriia bacterium]|nr:penicillin-binding protein [Paludibacteraceae bacterium]NCA79463.1 PASTA domain-containing protein [Sphingobacteriia bacterium]